MNKKNAVYKEPVCGTPWAMAGELKLSETGGVQIEFVKTKKDDQDYEYLGLPSYLKPVEPYEWVNELHAITRRVRHWFKF